MLKVLFLSIFIFCNVQESELKKKNITEYLSMSVSTELREMTQQELSAKFLGAKIPDAAFTNDQSAIEFTVTGSPTFWLEKDIALLKDFYDASIPSLFNDIKFEKQQMVSIDGHQFIAYQFDGTPEVENTSRMPEKRFTYLLYAIYRGGLVTISFSCPPYLKEKWKPIAEKMFETMKFR
jgi:hypothetical protein